MTDKLWPKHKNGVDKTFDEMSAEEKNSVFFDTENCLKKLGQKFNEIFDVGEKNDRRSKGSKSHSQ